MQIAGGNRNICIRGSFSTPDNGQRSHEPARCLKTRTAGWQHPLRALKTDLPSPVWWPLAQLTPPAWISFSGRPHTPACLPAAWWPHQTVCWFRYICFPDSPLQTMGPSACFHGAEHLFYTPGTDSPAAVRQARPAAPPPPPPHLRRGCVCARSHLISLSPKGLL